MTASMRVAVAVAVAVLLAPMASVPAAAYGKAGAAAASPVTASPPKSLPRPAVARLVDLNSASRDDLQTLPGIDAAAAQRIVAARPYPSKAKLVAEQVISFEVFLSLKDRVVALQQPALRARQSPHGSRRP